MKTALCVESHNITYSIICKWHRTFAFRVQPSLFILKQLYFTFIFGYSTWKIVIKLLWLERSSAQ